nr:hypothetical protein [Tanacetum cinerariifolium]
NPFDCPPDPYHPPHPTYETYASDSCGNDSYFGYNCLPQFPLNYEPEPGYIQNYNSYPYDSSSLPQQYLCCVRCGGPHETCQRDQLIFDEPYCKHCGGPHMNYQFQPMNQDSYNSNSLSFNQPQPPQSPVIHQPPQELSIQEMEDLKQQYLDELKRLSNLEYRDEIKIAELKENFNGMSIEIRKKEKLLQQEQWAYLSTHPFKRLHSFCFDDDDEDYTFAITPDEPVLSTEEPDNSLSMEDEHLDTIPATESDKFIKSDQIEDFSESNEEFSSTDDDSFSLDNIDYVEASPPDSELVSSEVDAFLAVKDKPTLSQFLKSYLDPEGDMLLFEAFLNDDHSFDFKTKSSSTSLNSLLEDTNNFDNSLQTKIKSFSPSPILVKDSDLLMEEINLFCTLDYPMPPGIEDKDYDSKRDILIRKDLPRNNTLSFAKKESFHFDIPPFSRPPAKPPDGKTGTLNIKMMGDISDQNAFMHKLMITLASQSGEIS